MVVLNLMGGIELRGQEGPADRLLSQPKRVALLAWLVLASPRGQHRRDRLLPLLWPDSDEPRARNSLSQAIYHLRRELGAEVLPSRTPETIGVAHDRIECDALALERAAAAGDWRRVRALYRGDLLPGFFVSGAAEFERWLERERQRLQELAVGAGWAAVREAEQSGDRATAAEAARWAAGLVPFDEEALRRLLAALDRAGDRAGVLEAFEGFAQRLRAEFGDQPAPETLELVARIRARRPSMDVETMAVDSTARGGTTSDGDAGTAAEGGGAAAAPVANGLALTGARPGAGRRWRGALATAGLVVGLAAGGALVARARRASPPEPKVVAVLPFASHGDPALAYVADGVTSLLEAKLDRAGGVRVADPRAVRALAEHRATADEDSQRALEAARRLRATWIVVGDVTTIGTRVQVRAELRGTDRPGAPVATATASGERDALFALADSLALHLLAEGIGIGRRDLQQAALVATASLPAFRAFLDGEAAMRAGRYAEAADRYRGAVALDSGFAIAAYRGAVALDWAGFRGDEIGRMLALADAGKARLTERQRRLLFAASAYYRSRADTARLVLERVLADDPDAVDAWYLLGETLFHYGPNFGRNWREAEGAFQHVVALDPDDPEALVHLVRIAAARRDRALVDSLAALVLPSLGATPRAWELRALQAWLSGDAAGRERFLRELRGAPPGAAREAGRGLAVYLEELEDGRAVYRLGPAGRDGSLEVQFAIAAGQWHAAFSTPEWCAMPDPTFCDFALLLKAPLPGAPLADPAVARAVREGPRLRPGSPEARGAYAALTDLLVLRLDRGAVDSATRAAAAEELRRLATDYDSVPSIRLWAELGTVPPAEDPASAAARAGRLLGTLAANQGRPFDFGDPEYPVKLFVAEVLAAGRADSAALALYRSIPDASGRDLHLLPYARLGEARILARRGDTAGARRLYDRVLGWWREPDPAFRPYVERVRAERDALEG